MKMLKCRFCQTPLQHVFIDLGLSPLANGYLTADELSSSQTYYPLQVFICSKCLLVQLPDTVSPEILFKEYLYFSSYSDTWLTHARNYAQDMIKRFNLSSSNLVIEVASNDGYLLQYFQQKQIPVLGIEPAENVANAAIKKGIPTKKNFLGEQTAQAIACAATQADLLIGNNVLAHVPDLNDFIKGLKLLLAPDGVLTLEFPYLLDLLKNHQFDTIYHEHFSYFSFLSVEKCLNHHGFDIFDVEQLPTHGGSLRLYIKHQDNKAHSLTGNPDILRKKEQETGLNQLDFFASFAAEIETIKMRLLQFLLEAKQNHKTVVGYGAPAKGNTLLNYCGIRSDLVSFTVDRNPEKQHHYLPGSQIPIQPVDSLYEFQPDYLLILPWNIKDEIIDQMSGVREWGGKFVIAIPELTIIP